MVSGLGILVCLHNFLRRLPFRLNVICRGFVGSKKCLGQFAAKVGFASGRKKKKKMAAKCVDVLRVKKMPHTDNTRLCWLRLPY